LLPALLCSAQSRLQPSSASFAVQLLRRDAEEKGEMAQLSRPYQIALGVLVLFAAVWFIALRGSSTNTSGSGSSAGSSATATPASPASTAAAEAKAAAAPTPIYHGAAPGVEGLTRAINKAHGAVATSQQNAKQLEEKSAQASNESAAGASTAGSHPTSAAASVTPSKGSTAASLDKPAVTHKGASAPSAKSVSGVPSMQASVERELKQGKVVAILFWNPKGSVDLAVQRELRAVGHALGGKLAVKDAEAHQVGSFGSITHAVQVYQTPTILIVNKHGQTTALTGLTDVFSIEQAIDEARHA